MTISTNCRVKVFLIGTANIAFLASVLWSGALSGGNPALGGEAKRDIPRPLAHHPGNVFLEGEDVAISVPVAGTWQLLDGDDREIKSLQVVEGKVELGRLPVGFYRLRSADHDDWVSLAVIAPLRVSTPPTSPIALDVAMSWFYPPEKMDDVASLCALAGVNWVRDRLSWPEVEPKRGEFAAETRYDAAARAQSAAGLKVLQVFHSSPRWANPESKRFPLDLRDCHAFLQHVARRWQGQVLAYEPWNEADIDNFGGHTGAEMASLQKAAYWGIKAGDPAAIVCWNVFAMNNLAQLADVDANAAWPYFETFNFHHYRPFEQYPQLYADFRAISAGRPLWISECAMPLQWSGDEEKKELTDADLFEQARRLIKVFTGSLHEGAAATFYFLLPHYVEGKTQFGIIRRDLTPRPAYVALAAVGRLLADARPLGRIHHDKLHAYVFEAKPDGQARPVVVAWATEAATLALPVAPQSAFDYMGRPIPAGREVTCGPSPVFLVLPPGTADQLELTAPPQPPADRQGGPCPVVFQATWPTPQVDLRQSAYRIPKESVDLAVPIYIYNFGTQACQGKVANTVSPGWTVRFPAEVGVAPGERVEQSLELHRSGPAAEEPIIVRLEGDFGPAGQAVLSIRLVTGK